MKIIGTTEVGEGYRKEKAFVAIISLNELQKVADKSRYSAERDNFPAPNVGDDYPIAEGYDFRNELLAAIKAMDEGYKQFAKVAPIAAKFLGVTEMHDQGAAKGDGNG